MFRGSKCKITGNFEQVDTQVYVMVRYSMVIIPADGVGLTGAILLGVPEC